MPYQAFRLPLAPSALLQTPIKRLLLLPDLPVRLQQLGILVLEQLLALLHLGGHLLQPGLRLQVGPGHGRADGLGRRQRGVVGAVVDAFRVETTPLKQSPD